MDGEVIGRKVDLNAHRSYKTLALALEIMFSKPSAGLCAPSKPYLQLLPCVVRSYADIEIT
jgi:hypothetical protein